jgi:hypothetical protein
MVSNKKHGGDNPTPISERNPSRRPSQRLTALLQTMLCPLPPEILDLIVDYLRNKPTTLKACCIVSKSWIHRARAHLFAHIEFHARKSHIKLWKKAFPDPSTSPAHHTRCLLVRGLSAVTSADANAGGWIRAFHNLVRLHLEGITSEECVSFVLFHGLSPTLRSLHLMDTSPEILHLICSFPLLEDLALIYLSQGGDTGNTPLTSPELTGSLNLNIFKGIGPVVRRLLDLPDGLHFAKITVTSIDADATPTTDLVARCSDTLESLSIDVCFPCGFPSTSMSGECLTTTHGPSHEAWETSA